MDSGSIHRELAGTYEKINPRVLEHYFSGKELEILLIKPPFVVRCDGVGFSKKLTTYKYPRDELIHRVLINAAKTVMETYRSAMALIISDEINYLFTHNIYGNRAVKISSVISALTSSEVARETGETLYFDGRVITVKPKEVIPYFLYRVRVGMNNYLSALYHTQFRKRGKSTPSFGEMFKRLEMEGYLRESEAWAFAGTLLVWETYLKRGVDKRTGRIVWVKRRRVRELIPTAHNIIYSYIELLKRSG
ncbi:MAG: hypothetical protein DRO10_02975 [Thermoprotei archaeon]|nr:MAG: hypothetical protein DRO10_02975 [Thermoprotei archaeon]